MINDTCEYCNHCASENGKGFCLIHMSPTELDAPMCGGAQSSTIPTASDNYDEPEVYNY